MRCVLCWCSKNEVVSDAGIRKLVTEQMAQWSEMMERQRKEEWGVLRTQVEEQKEHLTKIIEQVQATQMKQLEAKHERLVHPHNCPTSEVKTEC